jgi:hypothetical protein
MQAFVVRLFHVNYGRADFVCESCAGLRGTPQAGIRFCAPGGIATVLKETHLSATACARKVASMAEFPVWLWSIPDVLLWSVKAEYVNMPPP